MIHINHNEVTWLLISHMTDRMNRMTDEWFKVSMSSHRINNQIVDSTTTVSHMADHVSDYHMQSHTIDNQIVD